MNKKYVIFLILICSNLILPAFATPAITLIPNQGFIGSTSTINGTGFHTSTSATIGTASTPLGFSGVMNAYQFTGLPNTGISTISAQVKVSDTGTGIKSSTIGTKSVSLAPGTNVQAYELTGLPTTGAITKQAMINVTDTGTRVYSSSIGTGTQTPLGFAGSMNAYQFTSLPTTGSTTTQLNVTVDDQGTGVKSSTIGTTITTISSISNYTYVAPVTSLPTTGSTLFQIGVDLGSGSSGTADAVIYADSSGSPGALLDSASFSATGTGFVIVTLANVTIPSSGKLWAGIYVPAHNQGVIIEGNNGVNGGCDTGQTNSPPNPFGTCTTNSFEPNVTVYYQQLTSHVNFALYTDPSGQPASLIATSGSTSVTSNGTLTIPISGTIPSNGDLYIAIQSDNYEMHLSCQNSGNYYYQTQSYGSFPITFSPTLASGNILHTTLSYKQPSTHVQLALYTVNASTKPGVLIAQSNSIAVTSNGTLTIPISGTIPNSGTVFLAITEDNSKGSFYFQGSGTYYYQSAIYGILPNPFVPITASGNFLYATLYYQQLTSHVNFALYTDPSGQPASLIATSGSTSVTSNGTLTIPISGTIPSNGDLYIAIQSDNSNMKLYFQGSGNYYYQTHSYGSFPATFSPTLAGGNTLYVILSYGTPNYVTFQWDSNRLTTIPNSVLVNNDGSFNNVNFTVPNAFIGITNVTATDTYGNSAIAGFNVLTFGVSSFTLTGYILANNGIFNPPVITLSSSASGNVTSLYLYNGNGVLLSNKTVSPHVSLSPNIATTIPYTLQDNSNPTGTITYYEQALVQVGSSHILITSNPVTLTYGSFTNGNLNFNQTNTNTIPIFFIRKDLNTTDTRLSVIYPSTMNMSCNLGYTFAFTNKTYGPPLTNIVYPPISGDVNSSFKFHNVQSEIINVICKDKNTNSTGRYVITQSVFPFQTQIASFRAGTFGTQGNFGIFDFVSLGVLIISMIGFNRKNESVGMFFSIGIIGAAAYFGIVSLPTFIIGSVIVMGAITYSTTRKQSEAF